MCPQFYYVCIVALFPHANFSSYQAVVDLVNFSSSSCSYKGSEWERVLEQYISFTFHEVAGR